MARRHALDLPRRLRHREPESGGQQPDADPRDHALRGAERRAAAHELEQPLDRPEHDDREGQRGGRADPLGRDAGGGRQPVDPLHLEPGGELEPDLCRLQLGRKGGRPRGNQPGDEAVPVADASTDRVGTGRGGDGVDERLQGLAERLGVGQAADRACERGERLEPCLSLRELADRHRTPRGRRAARPRARRSSRARRRRRRARAGSPRSGDRRDGSRADARRGPDVAPARADRALHGVGVDRRGLTPRPGAQRLGHARSVIAATGAGVRLMTCGAAPGRAAAHRALRQRRTGADAVPTPGAGHVAEHDVACRVKFRHPVVRAPLQALRVGSIKYPLDDGTP